MIKVKGQVTSEDYEQRFTAPLAPWKMFEKLFSGMVPEDADRLSIAIVGAMKRARVEKASQSYDWWESL
jgi:hypothetical protein